MTSLFQGNIHIIEELEGQYLIVEIMEARKEICLDLPNNEGKFTELMIYIIATKYQQ